MRAIKCSLAINNSKNKNEVWKRIRMEENGANVVRPPGRHVQFESTIEYRMTRCVRYGSIHSLPQTLLERERAFGRMNSLANTHRYDLIGRNYVKWMD